MAGLLALLTLLGTFAWLTRHPDAEIVRRAQEWPIVGPLAGWFREVYLHSPRSPAPADQPGPEPTAAESDGADAEPHVVVVVPSPEDIGARSHIWVPAGTPVYAEPDLASSVLERVPSLSNPARLDQRGDWFRIRRARPEQPPLEGWVLLEDYRDPEPELLRQPEPVFPLPAAAPDPERVAAARAVMTGGGVAASCGPHPLYTDAREQGFSSFCARLVHALEDLYTARYGLEPVSPPAEAIFAFRRKQDYEAFRDQEGVEVESSLAHASPSRGYLALPLEAGDRAEAHAVLIHELTHLLNRRALGPALPPWLDEGLADDLAASQIDGDGSLHPELLVGERRDGEGAVVRWGGLASIILVLDALDRNQLPTLQELVQLDRTAFHRTAGPNLHYSLSLFWVRYLVSGFEPPLTAGFRGFLGDVAGGRALTEELLLKRLGRDWSELESEFRLWLRLQYIPPRDEVLSNAPRERAQDS